MNLWGLDPGGWCRFYYLLLLGTEYIPWLFSTQCNNQLNYVYCDGGLCSIGRKYAMRKGAENFRGRRVYDNVG